MLFAGNLYKRYICIYMYIWGNCPNVWFSRGDCSWLVVLIYAIDPVDNVNDPSLLLKSNWLEFCGKS